MFCCIIFRALDSKIGGVYHARCVGSICVFFLRIRVRRCFSASDGDHRFEDVVSIDFGCLSCNALVFYLYADFCECGGQASFWFHL